MHRTARAAVLTAPKRFDIQEFPLPPIGPNEALVRMVTREESGR